MKYVLSFLWEIGKVAFVAFVLVVGLRFFVFQPFLVRGASMEPSFRNWDYLVVDEFSYRFRAPERGEVIVFKYPNDPAQRYIKRIIGLPGETIGVQDGVITVSRDGERFTLEEEQYLGASDTPGSLEITLHENEYFVMGDNRRYSSDSRSWGPVGREAVIGRVLLRVFPLSAFAKVESPGYEFNE